ncbi:hypothetical protein Bca4012_043985 [Brassica carinata]
MALDASSNGNFNTRNLEEAVKVIENLASSNSTKNIDFERKRYATILGNHQMDEVKVKLDSVHKLLRKQVSYVEDAEVVEGRAEEEENPKLESLSSPLSRTHRLRLYYVVFAGQFLHGFHRTNLQYWVTILLTIVAASNISSAPAGVSDSIPVSANDEVLSSAYIKEKTLKKLSKQQLMGPYAMKKVQIQNKEQLELVRVEIRVSSLFNQPSCSLLDNVGRGHEQT